MIHFNSFLLCRGVDFLRNGEGAAAGSCYVEFLTAEDLKLALSKDKQYMGSRFCHVTRSTDEERENILLKQNEGWPVNEYLAC